MKNKDQFVNFKGSQDCSSIIMERTCPMQSGWEFQILEIQKPLPITELLVSRFVQLLAQNKPNSLSLSFSLSYKNVHTHIL